MTNLIEELRVHIALWRQMAHEGQLEATAIPDPFAQGHLLGISDSLRLLADTVEKTLDKCACQESHR